MKLIKVKNVNGNISWFDFDKITKVEYEEVYEHYAMRPGTSILNNEKLNNVFNVYLTSDCVITFEDNKDNSTLFINELLKNTINS